MNKKRSRGVAVENDPMITTMPVTLAKRKIDKMNISRQALMSKAVGMVLFATLAIH